MSQAPIRRQVFEVDKFGGHHLHCGAGKNLMVVPGWALKPATYRQVAVEFAKLGHNVVIPDLYSVIPTATKACFESYVEALEKVAVEAFGEEAKFDLIGHSLGGAISIEAASALTDRIEKLVLVNAIGHPTWSKDNDVSVRSRTLIDWSSAFIQDGARSLLVSPQIFSALFDGLGEILKAPQRTIECALIARSSDIRPAMQRVKDSEIEVLTIWGSRDVVVTRDLFEEMTSELGASSIVVDANHGWPFLKPQAFAGTVQAFLA
ncbi:MAG: alpha/beta hydrolase [Actinomycetota bacterium]|nr:alpha/beta hydrolase [Actinomycetota bacterium]